MLGCIPAFAEAEAGNVFSDSGAIAGGFFSDAAPRNQGPAPAPRAQALPANPVNPEAARQGANLCESAIAQATAGQNLPAGLLNAIAVVESGRADPQTGVVKPWPWTIDADGAGSMYPTEQAAEQAATAFEASGVTSLDIGCLQVNLAQHPDAFQNLAQAFDPAANSAYAAAFLTALQRQFGNWPQAVAAYHSQTPALGGPYATRVYAQWQGTGAEVATHAAFSGTSRGMMAAASQSATALPVPALAPTSFEMASLIPPARMMMRQNNSFTGRSLASYRANPVAIAVSLPPG